jgi:hypothetical protein
MSVSINTILTYVCDEGLTFTAALEKTYKQGLFEGESC